MWNTASQKCTLLMRHNSVSYQRHYELMFLCICMCVFIRSAQNAVNIWIWLLWLWLWLIYMNSFKHSVSNCLQPFWQNMQRKFVLNNYMNKLKQTSTPHPILYNSTENNAVCQLLGPIKLTVNWSYICAQLFKYGGVENRTCSPQL